MAKIKIVPGCPLCDGLSVMFKAPCNCNEVDGLLVNGSEFSFRDAHGNDLTGIGDLFVAGAVVKALLDTANGYAYIQNADTNAYIEARLNKTADKIGATIVPVSASRTLEASDAGQFLRVETAATITVPADTFPLGAEIEVFRYASGGVTIAANGVSFALLGTTWLTTAAQTIKYRFASVVLKQIADNVWSIQGAV